MRRERNGNWEGVARKTQFMYTQYTVHRGQGREVQSARVNVPRATPSPGEGGGLVTSIKCQIPKFYIDNT